MGSCGTVALMVLGKFFLYLQTISANIRKLARNHLSYGSAASLWSKINGPLLTVDLIPLPYGCNFRLLWYIVLVLDITEDIDNHTQNAPNPHILYCYIAKVA